MKRADEAPNVGKGLQARCFHHNVVLSFVTKWRILVFAKINFTSGSNQATTEHNEILLD